MSFETLLVQLELGRSNAAPLGVARDLARRIGAAVNGVAVALPLQTAMAAEGFYSGNFVIEDVNLIENEAVAAKREFLAAMADGVECGDWAMGVTEIPLAERVAAASATADLVVVGIAQQSEQDRGPSRRVEIDDLVMQTGRPVLAVPLSVGHFAFRCAMVAWKDRREARRAIADALPLLKHMDRVILVEVAPLTEQGTAQAGLFKMAAWLARHGIEATSRLVTEAGADSERLLAVAEEEGADLIIAGAYGHSRFREWVMGGVTRDLLRKGGRCVFLSH